MQPSQIKILLVDDDQQDTELTMEVLEMTKVSLDIVCVYDGTDAMRYLLQQDEYKDATLPDLILLDLNMPKKSGTEVLQEIKKIEHLRKIPVVILTTSSAEEDIVKTYDLGASCYVTKPVGLKQFESVVKAIDDFWFTVVKFPKVR